MKTKLHLLILAVLALLFGAATTSNARTVAWYSAIGDDFLHTNSTAWDSTLNFELGSFAVGFTPTAANVSLWQSNWLTFDTATDANAGWNSTPGIQNFTGTAQTLAGTSGRVYSSTDPVGNNTTTNQFFPDGHASEQQAYIWAYNSKSFSPTTEWALIGNTAWAFPTTDPSNPVSIDFALGDSGNSAILGSLSQVPVGPDTFSTLQTVVVPEPGSALLIAVAGILLRLRRSSRVAR